jgi:hypothetical protein
MLYDYNMSYRLSKKVMTILRTENILTNHTMLATEHRVRPKTFSGIDEQRIQNEI